jgi:alkanesulfonate monooxygenase
MQRVRNVAQWSESSGCRGILVYSDNGLVDPWHVAQHILQHTTTLAPLIAVQPISMHPFTAAKKVASLGYLFDRQVFLNMIAGGFKNDLVALNDNTPHDDRYVRLSEYTQIISRLLSSDRPVSFEGKYYTVRNLKMNPPLPADLMPGILMSGSSPAGVSAAKEVGAIAIKYPQRPKTEARLEHDPDLECGIRVGIIARETSEDAWQVAHERFPTDRKGQVMHKLAMNVSDSHWHKQLSAMAAVSAEQDDPYWLGPFENYRTFCPYLVGSHDKVAEQLSRYIGIGHDTFILDIPPSEEELWHANVVFKLAIDSSTVKECSASLTL